MKRKPKTEEPKLHPLILGYLEAQGIPVSKVDIGDPEHIAIYNKSLEESK